MAFESVPGLGLSPEPPPLELGQGAERGPEMDLVRTLLELGSAAELGPESSPEPTPLELGLGPKMEQGQVPTEVGLGPEPDSATSQGSATESAQTIADHFLSQLRC